ncbi:DUF4959 domain-containing protein [Niabella beijingensis]|uniref:DUF4959 domain-containing protein n=1 Tax=Niabella beijingensis TaxID=2872700 RepID=UPI001CBE9319|nr:DUF4959 domain-containing protein [Niabella beijingensis]MBZ4187374.1 DUF4959 domain-containing protein [Niabella beijingensis]
MNNRFFSALYAVIAVMLLLYVTACTKISDFNTPASADKTKPGTVTDIKVTNFNGGAYITYSLPKSDNILYVKANYVVNDKTGTSLETKSSYYSDTLTVNGFAEKKEYAVILRVVSRANVESDPVEVKVHPDTPVYQVVAKTLSLSADFAGVRINAINELQKNVGVVFLYNDPYYGKYTIRQQVFSSFSQISFPSRGFDTLPKPVAAYTTDQWGNTSDTLFQTIKPLYEIELNKSNFFEYNLPSNSKTDEFGWVTPRLWDNNNGSGWHTNQSRPPIILPATTSFGIGVLAKLSRFKLVPRDGYLWAHGNPKSFMLWGSSAEQPGDFSPPYFADEGTVMGDWVNIGNYRYPDPPSGSLTPTDADRAWARPGTDFDVPFAAPKVKFLRVVVPENWGGDNNFAHIMELTFYGDPR